MTMIFQISLEKLIDASIDIKQYLFLKIAETKNIKILDLYLEQFDRFYNKESIDDLISKGFVELSIPEKYTWTSINVTDKYLDMFKDEIIPVVKSVNCNDWIDDWYNLFPKGLKAGGYLVRSGLSSCKTKMNTFLKKNSYSKEVIMKATEYYLFELKKSDYRYIQLAKYFIEKNGTSALESCCELITDKLKSGDPVEFDDKDKFTTSLNG